MMCPTPGPVRRATTENERSSDPVVSTRFAAGKAATVLAVLALTAGPSPSAHAQSAPPPSTEQIARLIAAIRTSSAANPAGGAVAAPPEAPDPTAPSSVLYRVLADLDALANTPGRGAQALSPADRRHIARARDAVQVALDRYGTSPNPADALRSLAEAARSLHAADAARRGPAHATLERLSNDLAGAAHDIAVALVRLGTSVGVRPTVIAELQRRVALGNVATFKGQHSVAIGHYGGAADDVLSNITFDIDRFEENLRAALEGMTIGHAYTIGLNGAPYSQDADNDFGDARTAADPPASAQSAGKEMYAASMSKTLSAVGLLKALNAAGLSVDDDIAPYLPESWVQGPNVDDLTFKHLLTHRSGLDPLELSGSSLEGQEFAALADYIADGTPGTLTFNNAEYTNANFSLMRILIPRLTADDGVITNYTNIWPEDVVYAAMYADYIRAEVLDPAGVDAQDCSPDEGASERTLGYARSIPNGHGTDFGDWSLGCGATGWYLSAIELGSFMAHLRYTDDIIDASTRELMDSQSLGWLNPVTFAGYVAGVFGPYRAHGGDSAVPQTTPGMSGCMMKYPLSVEATVLVNSRGDNPGGHACTLLRDAYDNAWDAP